MSEQIINALRSGDAQAALELAKALLAQEPHNPDGHYWLALAQQGLGEKALALSAIGKAIEIAPERNEFAMVRSVMLLGEADLAAAQSGLMDTLALNPNQIEAYVALIHIALAQKNIPEARRLLRLVERVNADNEHVQLAKGAVLQAEGDLDEALKHFTRASEINPSNPLALSSLGMLYLVKDMPAFAEQALKRAYALAPGNVTMLRALLQSQLKQEQFAQAENTADEILRHAPQDQNSLFLRGQLRAARRDPAGAVEDARVLRALNPDDDGFLTQLVTWLIQDQRADEAKAEMQAAVAGSPHNDAFWQLLANYEMTVADGDPRPVIERWLVLNPDSGLAHDTFAVVLENLLDFDAAGHEADKALAHSDSFAASQFIKLRQEIRENPQLALQRAEALIPKARNTDAQRMILAWLGIIHDRLGQYASAADAFRLMTTILLAAKPLPMPMPADHVPEAESLQGRLLWAPAGARVERVFNALAPLLGKRLLIDRNVLIPTRQDGFGSYRALPGAPEAGSAAKWLFGVSSMGVAAEDAVDWIPQWDAYTAAALPGTELLALLIDPRDAFLNWLVFGNAQGYWFLPDELESARWLELSYSAVADTLEKGPQTVHVVKIDALDTQADAIGVQLQQALGLDAAPNADALARPILALGGMVNQFPTGHWRHYRDAYGEAFAVLTPVAVRLGYPEA
ncbi:MAG: tetratricopeptide repeat protein [Arenimonas sp.]|nr:tetratricopeptide repeat protein [Arenimonas sp.]MBP7981542.1 tetratricopeptide repeat protein [Arenimonas sp.]